MSEILFPSSPHTFLSYIYIYEYKNLHTHSNMYAIHQSKMLFRNGYRFGRKSPFLGCLMSCSLSPRHRDCTEAFCWCSQRPGGTWAGTCNFPVKQPRSILVTQGGASPRGTIHRGHTLSGAEGPAFVTLPLALQRVRSYECAEYPSFRNTSVGTKHRHKAASNISTKEFLAALIIVT